MAKKMSKHTEYLMRMERFLKEQYPECVLMPTKNNDARFDAIKDAAGSKNPLRPHKRESTKALWRMWDTELKHMCDKGLLIILRKDLVVIDIDDNEQADELERLVPEIKNTSVQTTRTGRHYFFKRSARCDELKLFDKSRCLKHIDDDGNEQTLPIDIKTVCSTGTGGVISIFPSPNKTWTRAPYDHPPLEMPEALLEYILERHKDYGGANRGLTTAPPNETDAASSVTDISWSKMTSVSQVNSELIASDRETIEALVMECLSARRADEYSDWVEIGMCLHHMSADRNNGDLYDLWVAFSKRSNKFDGERVCQEKWKSFAATHGKRIVTERTLKLRARQDDPEAYRAIIMRNLGALIAKCAADGSNGTVATVVHRLYKDEFVCSSIKNRQWYIFEAHRWRPIEDAFVLRRRMSLEVSGHFARAAARIQAKAADAECDSDRRAALSKTSQQLANIAVKLDDTRFKELVLRECADMFYDADFAAKLDSDDRLLCFENGVYDLDSGTFRAGRPDDNLSLSVGYEYASEVDERFRNELVEFVTSTQKTAEMGAYVMKVLAYMLHGFKYMECLWFFTGRSGRNGKGTLASLLKATFGKYYYEPNAAVFTTTDRNPSAACPEVANMKGKRCVVASEPPDTDGQTFKVHKLKNWRGNDMITARDMYAKPITFRPQFGIILMMNDKPCLDKLDNAIARTLSIVDFPYEFVEAEGRTLAPNQKALDAGIKQRFEQDVRYRQQFMLLLLDTYRANHSEIFGAKKPIPRPQEVVDATDEYINDNNEIGGWLEETFEKTGDNKDRLGSAEVFRLFKADNPTSRMSTSAFKNAMVYNGWVSRKHVGVMTYFGYRYRPSTDDGLPA